NSQGSERTIVVGVGLKQFPFTELKESLAELADLVEAAGGDVVSSIAQVLPQYNSSTLLGSGKVQEVREAVESLEATLVVVDHQLSGVQIRNLEKEIGCRVIDRSQLILDIFAQRAQTYEGKLQVELAQMLDQLPRMVGAWLGSLSRQGGGIGTRGPGETALEMDRRRINNRVKQIKKKLEGVKSHRSQHRAWRRKYQIPSFALIGYTNTGKSTLLNALTKAQAHTKDQVFATLDPMTKKVELPGFKRAVITDTVGFIRKLPTHLIEAFKATLEESGEAEVLLHVIDLSSAQMNQQIETVNELIKEFGWSEKPVIHVFNKMDQAGLDKQFKIHAFPRVFVSAQTGEGLDKLRQMMSEAIQHFQQSVE
ncbi:MAG: GTPase HflX, partial [Bdellovibrionales bacterium]|nr:GTPase HflX [Bdellovibrionales bacterium]